MTVAIPFLNEQPEHFKMAIKSVFAQTYSNWRLLLVSDGARPDLVSIARSVAGADPRVTVMHDGQQLGLAERLNQSVAATQTEFFVRMDADDIMRPARLQSQWSRLHGSGLDISAGRASVIDDVGNPGGLLRERVGIPEEPRDRVRSNLMTHPAVAGRADWFRQHPYSTLLRRAEDKELWLRTIDVSRFEKVDEPVLHYRVSREFARRKCVQTVIDGHRAGLVYSSSHLSPVERARHALITRVKVIAYSTMPSASWSDVRAKRVELVSASTLDQWRSEIAAVRAIVLPGMDELR